MYSTFDCPSLEARISMSGVTLDLDFLVFFTLVACSWPAAACGFAFAAAAVLVVAAVVLLFTTMMRRSTSVSTANRARKFLISPSRALVRRQ